MASFSGVGTPSSRPNRPMPPFRKSTSVRPSGLDVLEHARLVPVGDLGLRCVVDQLLGVGVQDDPLRGCDGLALVDETRDERAERDVLADPPVRQARQSTDRVACRVEDHLAPLRGSRIVDRVRRHARARAGVGETLDLRARSRLAARRARASCRPSRPTARRRARGPSQPGRSSRGSHVERAARSPPRCRPRSAPTRRRRRRTRARVAAIAAAVCIALVATMPKSHGGNSAASVVARG